MLPNLDVSSAVCAIGLAEHFPKLRVKLFVEFLDFFPVVLFPSFDVVVDISFVAVSFILLLRRLCSFC